MDSTDEPFFQASDFPVVNGKHRTWAEIKAARLARMTPEEKEIYTEELARERAILLDEIARFDLTR